MGNPRSRRNMEHPMLNIRTMDVHVKLNMDFHDIAGHEKSMLRTLTWNHHGNHILHVNHAKVLTWTRTVSPC